MVKKLKTWHYEFVIVIFLLITITFLFANNFDNWLATLAVCLTFGYTQISDRMMEKQGAMITPDVDCYWKLVYYFWGKELIWIIVFLRYHSYASLGGCFIFAVYPLWRKFYRAKIKPLSKRVEYICPKIIQVLEL